MHRRSSFQDFASSRQFGLKVAYRLLGDLGERLEPLVVSAQVCWHHDAENPCDARELCLRITLVVHPLHENDL